MDKILKENHSMEIDLSQFPKESRVDCVINGHTHYKSKDSLAQKSGGLSLATVQAGSYCNAYGMIRYHIEADNSLSSVNVSCNTLNKSTEDNLRVEICNACHPLFTGQQKIVDTEGRVEKFKKRYEKAKK